MNPKFGLLDLIVPTITHNPCVTADEPPRKPDIGVPLEQSPADRIMSTQKLLAIKAKA